MALCVLAYNMKRVMGILGLGGLMEAIRAQDGFTPPGHDNLRHSRFYTVWTMNGPYVWRPRMRACFAN
jgi:hypothetical protein